MITPPQDDAIAQSLHAELINPFVYRRYLDYGVFESLRDMKSRIAAEVRSREMARNIKLGPGGIREIEFIVQSLQLVRGGSLPQLQCSSLQQALKVLREVKEIGYRTAADLDRTYCFLRRLENFLQALRDQQTPALPTNRDRPGAAGAGAQLPGLGPPQRGHQASPGVRHQPVRRSGV
ncbi:MAG: hypothetical protein U5K38_07950 [Woeseiaceae bacterium]|nr:hypothetical protein [Woeseiaceae bacterium]